ncbi:SpoIIE family protein phosphatase [Streptomyces stelliscabiei]|uniref:SpoIIE family protein phosphatase n=1 Tax=Streptomyces stelliscabiei TaxID=146820 RepID=UPI0029B85FC6|nr:SpoIIE family protein phosphatase [Streptomyces stelliscabiei]MDX2550798.1 SpoIIE family protein phosphatase [Streptomyces stelliscabiei]MDX2616819.1 SpoIIE family protein phosphatase [Streptomyces stelliscabiei]MDX2635815.1 SpoIIE family protein phosphatase [Streptomyces stelliscabiei]MDX2665567.1 SpoIIE family protein phosphatase [Streptomyces stelliscabiei]MDX2717849.1 SpoIIE family protein phosphatase [Streptomyces stelliscabiei]
MSKPHQPAEPQDAGAPTDQSAVGGPTADTGLLSDDYFGVLSVPRDDLPAVPGRQETDEEAADGREGDGKGVSTPVGRLAATVERLRREVQEAQAEADGRALIELAKGILVERLGCGPSQAARQLAELTEQAGVTPLEFAVDVINQAARDRLSEVTTTFLAITEGRHEAPEAPGGDSPAVRLRTAESGALAAHDAQAVADSLLEHALTPLGAEAVAIWALGADGSLTLAGSAGFPAAEAARWRYVPPGVATVARHGLGERRGHWIGCLSEAGLPSIGRHHHPDGGRVAVPAGTGGRIHGVLEIVWPTPLQDQPPQIVRQIEALAELCAHALETNVPDRTDEETRAAILPDVAELINLADGLHDPALVLVPYLDATGELVDFRIQHVNSRFLDPAGRPRGVVNGALLLETYPMAAGERELFGQVERVYATGEPFRARRMRLTSLVDEVPLSAVADVNISRHGGSVLLIWRIEDETARLASLLQHAQRLGRIGGFEENLLTGEITWNGQLYSLYGKPSVSGPVPLEDLPAHAHPDDAVAIGRFLRTLLHHRRPASAAFRLQRPDGVTRHIRVVAEPVLDSDGRLFVVRGAYQDISAHHWTEVALAATRDQLAHSEQQASERDRLTLQLQHAIMPPAQAPLEAPGLRVAVRYRPAETQNLVGGDWYDAVVLPSGLVLLCVGDVAGHGIEAATSMVVLRNALRGLAVTGAGPGQLLSWLNMVAHHLTGAVTATAVCGLYDPDRHTLRWARAGHLPPVLVRAGEATPLPLVKGLLLGALPDATYEENETQLAVDDTLLMYTDGLIERRDRSVEESLAQLLTAARTVPPTLDQQLDRLLTHSKSDTDDDTCLVGVQVT